MAKNTTPPKPQENGVNTNGSKIDMIKDLIFGDNIQEYNSQFETVKEDIAAKKTELEDLVQNVRTELDEMIDTLGTDINIRVTQLQDKMEERLENLESDKMDKEILGKLLISLGEKISKG